MSNPIAAYAAYARDEAYALASKAYSLEGTQQAIDFSKQVVQTAQDVVEAGAALSIIAGREIEKITNANLSPNLARIAQRVFNGSGIAAADLFFPGPLVTAGFITYGTAQVFYGVSPRIVRNVHDGLALSYTYHAAFDLTSFVITRHPINLVSAVVNSIIATAFMFTGPDALPGDDPEDSNESSFSLEIEQGQPLVWSSSEEEDIEEAEEHLSRRGGPSQQTTSLHYRISEVHDE